MAQTTPGTSAVRPSCVGGLYELCVGVPDLAESIAYYERFGCRAGRFGTLDAASALALYGVDSALRSVRLHHLDADHGLVRLMQWERPRNDGLGIDPNLRCVGSRWGVRLTTSVLNVANHAARARELGQPIEVIDPILAVIGEITGEAAARPFAEPIVGVREMVVIQPYYRQVFFERFGYQSPLYGRVDAACVMQTSQHTHAGLMIANDDHQVLRFYDEVLGLKRWFDAERPYEQATGSRTMSRRPARGRFSASSPARPTGWWTSTIPARATRSTSGAPESSRSCASRSRAESRTSSTARAPGASATRSTPGGSTTSRACGSVSRGAAPRP